MGGSWQEADPLPCEGGILAIEVGVEGAAIVLVLRGELDLAGASPLASALEAAIAAGQSRLVLELGHLAFIDGSGVRLIERARQRLRAQGGELTLRHSQPHVRRILELCEMLSGLTDDRNVDPAPVAQAQGSRRGSRAMSRPARGRATGGARPAGSAAFVVHLGQHGRFNRGELSQQERRDGVSDEHGAKGRRDDWIVHGGLPRVRGRMGLGRPGLSQPSSASRPGRGIPHPGGSRLGGDGPPALQRRSASPSPTTSGMRLRASSACDSIWRARWGVTPSSAPTACIRRASPSAKPKRNSTTRRWRSGS
jgi:anti-sigma B factor antagonist